MLAWGKAEGRRPRYGAQENLPLFFSIRFGAPRLQRAKPDGKKESAAAKDLAYARNGIRGSVGAETYITTNSKYAKEGRFSRI
jgi:hypothetical protein